MRLLKAFRGDGPEGSQVSAENADHDDVREAVWLEASPMRRYPLRHQHATRPLPPYSADVHHDSRHRIETVGSVMERRRPKPMHAVTAAGVEVKGCLCVLA